MDEKRITTIGMVIGSGLGSVLYVLTDFPGWIGFGAGFGILFGFGFARRRGAGDN